MNTGKSLATAFAIVLAGLLAAGCAGDPPPPSAGNHAPEAESFIGRQVAKGIAEAQRKLETENIPVDNSASFTINGRRYGTGRRSGDLPRAEITPQGELLIAGEPVPATARQRDMLLDHRGRIIDLARAGMAVGAQGADIAGTALTGIGGLLFGGEQGRKAYEERIEAEAEKIKHEAIKLCALLPALYDSQQALAASMPEFAPYATMTRKDVDDCGEDLGSDIDVDVDAGIQT